MLDFRPQVLANLPDESTTFLHNNRGQHLCASLERAQGRFHMEIDVHDCRTPVEMCLQTFAKIQIRQANIKV